MNISHILFLIFGLVNYNWIWCKPLVDENEYEKENVQFNIFAEIILFGSIFRALNPLVQESDDLPALNRSTRKPSISILLTIDDNGDNGQIKSFDLDEDEDSYEIKRKIGKRLIKKLVRAGDVDRKPNFYDSYESGCQKQINSKYDELMAALKNIVDRAMQSDANRIGQIAQTAVNDENSEVESKSPLYSKPTTPPMPIIADEGTVDDHESTEERLYKYIMSIQNQLGKLMHKPQNEKSKSQPVKRYSQQNVHQVNYDNLAREILKGIGLDTGDRNGKHFDIDSDDYDFMQKYPIASVSRDAKTDDPYGDEYDEMEAPDEIAELMPTRNLTKRQVFWSRDESNKLMEKLRKRIRFSREPIDYCVNCHRRMRRRADIETSADDSTTGTTQTIDSDAETTIAAESTTDEYLLHFANNAGVDSEDESETEAVPETTTRTMTESLMAMTTESVNNQSTLEPPVADSATEPSIEIQSDVPNEGHTEVTGTNKATLTITKDGIRVPLRLLRDSRGQLKFILDRKLICSSCKCKCKRRKPKQRKKQSLHSVQ